MLGSIHRNLSQDNALLLSIPVCPFRVPGLCPMILGRSLSSEFCIKFKFKSLFPSALNRVKYRCVAYPKLKAIFVIEIINKSDIELPKKSLQKIIVYFF